MATNRSNLLILLFGLAYFLPVTAEATKFWKNSITTGNWSTGNNWSGVSAAGVDNGGVPAANEQVRIVNTDGIARTVTLDTNPPALGLVSIDLTGAGTTTNTLLLTSGNNLTSGAMFIGGHNGVTPTNGRGTVTQSAGTHTISSGVDLVVGYGAGSSGVYNLSGTGSLIAPQSIFLGNSGTGTINQSAGTVTVNAGSIGSFNMATFAGSNGLYNLSGTGQFTSNKSEYIGDQGTGTFTQTGGANTIQGAGNHLYLGNAAGGVGNYSISGGTLTANNDVNVGVAGTATLNISGTGSVYIGNNLAINATSNVNLNGGMLRLNTGSGLNRVNYTAGTVRLAGNRNLNNDAVISVLFGPADYSIPTGKTLEIEQVAELSGGSNFSVLGGTLRSLSNGSGGGDFRIGENGNGTLQINSGGAVSGNVFQIGSSINAANPFNGTVTVSGAGSSLGTSTLRIGGKGNGTLNISSGATVTTSNFANVGNSNSSGTGSGTVVLSGAGSTWTIGSSLGIGSFGTGTVTLEAGTTLDVVTGGIGVSSLGTINLNGGTLKFPLLSGGEHINFNSGTIYAYGSHTLGTDTSLTPLFGVAPYITSGKNLTVEGLATLNSRTTIDGGVLTVGSLNSGGTVAVGGNLDFIRGKLNITNQVVNITSTGAVGQNLDLNDDAILSAPLGIVNFSLVTGDGQLEGPFTNNFGAELRGEAGKSLRLLSPATNAGRINLLGGLLDFDQTLTNLAGGLVSGNGSLKARNGLTNQGTMNFAGTANIVGDVVNSAGAKIISGGGGATIFFDDVANNGEIRTSTNGFTVFYGAVSGAGSFTGTGTVNFEGDLTPGNSPAALAFGGDVAFGAGATLQMELGGTSPGTTYDQLQVADSLALDGALVVSLINGFNPAAGDSFNLLNWGSLSGTFSTLVLPNLDGGLSWNTSQLYTTGTLSVVGGVLGDYNNNGVVDAADYVLWRNGGPLANEVDTPGTINAQDYAAWRARFGNTANAAAASLDANSAVPEPAAGEMLVLAAAALQRARRRRRWRW
ncbi:MAG: hypothetical protein U0805_05930 [Pirellulales bacterium]